MSRLSDVTFFDIAQAKEHQNELERNAYIEALTGARLRFHYDSDPNAAALYRRWAQLYNNDIWRTIHDFLRP